MKNLSYQKPLSWAPVRRGKIYCSPACGGDCTMAAFRRATQEADKLATRMGAGWRRVVWENLGWFYKIEKGNATIHHDTTGYTVFLHSAVQVIGRAQTPEDALGFAIRDARGIARRIAADCAALLD